MNEFQEQFERCFQQTPSFYVRAPGRVNLIGGHVDYNQGLVLPVAIDRYVEILASPRSDNRVRVRALDYDQEDRFDIGTRTRSEDRPWSNYVRGVVREFVLRGDDLTGASLLIRGNIPKGAGLSSSAALEVSCAQALCLMNSIPMSPLELAGLTRQAEVDFVGVHCGIMDQLISAAGKRNLALRIDCRDLSMRQVPLPRDLAIVVCDSRVERTLADSEYNIRRNQCEQAVAAIRDRFPQVESLRDVSEKQLEASALPRLLHRRARHVVQEIGRVERAVEALEQGRLDDFGRCMYGSHRSLRDDYEVSCLELDLLVDLVSRQPAALGARLTGAGFGGCIVCLARREGLDVLLESVPEQYREATGRRARVYACAAAGGVEGRKLR